MTDPLFAIKEILEALLKRVDELESRIQELESTEYFRRKLLSFGVIEPSAEDE